MDDDKDAEDDDPKQGLPTKNEMSIGKRAKADREEKRGDRDERDQG